MHKHKSPLWYEVSVRREHSYSTTVVRVFEGNEQTHIASMIAKCVDNEAGYSTPEAAAKMQAHYESLQRDGYYGVVSASCTRGFTLDWLHYSGAEGGYCEAAVNLPTRLCELRASYPLFTRILAAAKRVKPHDRLNSPAAVLQVLARRGTRVYHEETAFSEFPITSLCTWPAGKPRAESHLDLAVYGVAS